MTRQRIEDLGRLQVIIENMLDHEIFREDRAAAESFLPWFCNQSIEKKNEIFRRWLSGIDDLENMLLGAIEIAQGMDELNDPFQAK